MAAGVNDSPNCLLVSSDRGSATSENLPMRRHMDGSYPAPEWMVTV